MQARRRRRVYHTIVLATKPATARGPRLRGGQTEPPAIGRPPGATVGRSRPRGAQCSVWHRSARCLPIALRAIGSRRSEITIAWRTRRRLPREHILPWPGGGWRATGMSSGHGRRPRTRGEATGRRAETRPPCARGGRRPSAGGPAPRPHSGSAGSRTRPAPASGDRAARRGGACLTHRPSVGWR